MSCETQESHENNSSDENQGSLIYSEYHLKKGSLSYPEILGSYANNLIH